MNAESLKEAIRRELPDTPRTDPEFRNFVMELTHREYADKGETRDRFHELLAELRQNRKWEERQMAMREDFCLVHEETMAQAKKFDRSVIISPMIDARALKVAEQRGIETFGDSLEVKTL